MEMNREHNYHFKGSRSHIKKYKETGEIHFNDIFYLLFYVQNTITFSRWSLE